MNVLALDGAFGGFSCAVVRDGTLSAHQAVTGNVALEAGLPLVLDTMRLAAVNPADVDVIAVGTGPGAFTGLRIAISYAKSLALGWRRPLTGINSFDALEYGIAQQQRLAVVSARPAVASVRLCAAGAQRRMSGPVGELCDEVAAEFRGRELSVIGAPEGVLCALGERGILVRTVASLHPPAVAMAHLAAEREHAPDLHGVRADYGELPAAKVPKLR